MTVQAGARLAGIVYCLAATLDEGVFLQGQFGDCLVVGLDEIFLVFAGLALVFGDGFEDFLGLVSCVDVAFQFFVEAGELILVSSERYQVHAFVQMAQGLFVFQHVAFFIGAVGDDLALVVEAFFERGVPEAFEELSTRAAALQTDLADGLGDAAVVHAHEQFSRGDCQKVPGVF